MAAFANPARSAATAFEIKGVTVQGEPIDVILGELTYKIARGLDGQLVCAYCETGTPWEHSELMEAAQIPAQVLRQMPR